MLYTNVLKHVSDRRYCDYIALALFVLVLFVFVLVACVALVFVLVLLAFVFWRCFFGVVLCIEGALTGLLEVCSKVLFCSSTTAAVGRPSQCSERQLLRLWCQSTRERTEMNSSKSNGHMPRPLVQNEAAEPDSPAKRQLMTSDSIICVYLSETMTTSCSG